MAKQPDLLVGLDIGTTEVRCLIGMSPAEEDKKFHILGLGTAVNEGMRAGVIVNYDEVVGAIDSAIKQAELNAGHQVESLTVNINGAHLRSVRCQAEVAITNSDRIATHFDRDLVDRKAKELNLPPNRSVVQFFPNSYRVDQVKNLENPVGVQGNVLGVQALAVMGLSAHVELLRRVCDEVGVQINNLTVSSLAAAEAAFNKKAFESGVAVVDIGHSTTNLVVIREGKIEHVSVIPLGGFNVTKDIAIILQVDLDVAEFLKIHYADLNYQGRGTKTIEFNRQSINFSPQNLCDVSSARLREICEFVEDILKETGFAQQLPGGIVLTGGVSQTKGLKELFQSHLKIHTRIGQLNNFGGLVETIEQKPEYLTLAGIMALDFILRARQAARAPQWRRGWRFLDIFRRKVKDKRQDFSQKLKRSLQPKEETEDDKKEDGSGLQ